MYQRDHKKHRANSACAAIALCAFAALGGRAAQAQTITDPFSFSGDASQLGPGAFTINNPADNGTGFVNSPVTISGNGIQVTYTALNGTPGMPSFETFNNFDGSLDFPKPTNLLDTFDGANNTGPLEIDFSQGVSAFGLRAQDSAFDQETFTITATDQNGHNFAFVSPTVDQTTSPSGRSVFLGAQGNGGSLITRVTISSVSTIGGVPTTGSNDFYFGPITLRSAPAVPEASTFVGSGMGLILFAGMLWSASRRKVSRGSQSAPQAAG